MVRGFWVVALFIALLGVSILSAPPARADFGNCNDPNYLSKFDERFAGSHDFLCTEIARFSVTSDAGVSHIRVIQHLNADWAGERGSIAALVRGVEEAATAMPRLGHFRLQDVTVLLVDGWALTDRREVWDGFGGYTDFTPGSECHVTLYLLGPAGTTEYAANVAAHELFHCVQRASLSQAQVDTSNGGMPGGGTWWIEGSAEWFTTLALPAPSYQHTRVEAFDHDSPATALNDMAYQAYVFFAWLGGAHGPNGVMPFLQQMASTSSPSAQRAAMAAAMPTSDWLRFAEDYMDRNIRDGHGVSIGSSPQDGTTLEWDDTRTERLALAPFTLVRRNLSVHCGRWRFAPRPAQYHAAKPTSGSWGDLPGDLDNLGNDHGDFRFVAMNTSASDVALQLAVTRTAQCADCAGSREHDQCMIATWQMTTDGAEQWMREHLRNYRSTGLSAVGNTMTLRADGTFQTGSAHTEASGTVGGASGHAHLDAQASGRWSTSDGQLNICADAANAAGQVTVTQNGHTVTVPTAPHIPPVSSTAYTCNGSTFTHTIPMGSRGAVTSIYNRISH